MMWSHQTFYCRACGLKMFTTIGADYSAQVCSKECWSEFKWRETLSIMGKQYYPRKVENNDDNVS